MVTSVMVSIAGLLLIYWIWETIKEIAVKVIIRAAKDDIDADMERRRKKEEEEQKKKEKQAWDMMPYAHMQDVEGQKILFVYRRDPAFEEAIDLSYDIDFKYCGEKINKIRLMSDELCQQVRESILSSRLDEQLPGFTSLLEKPFEIKKWLCGELEPKAGSVVIAEAVEQAKAEVLKAKEREEKWEGTRQVGAVLLALQTGMEKWEIERKAEISGKDYDQVIQILKGMNLIYYDRRKHMWRLKDQKEE